MAKWAWQHGRDPRSLKAGGMPYDEVDELTLPAELQARKPRIY